MSIELSERVQKFLANQGVASRREIERWIVAGEIQVDGELCVLGQRITGNVCGLIDLPATLEIPKACAPLYFDLLLRQFGTSY